MILAFVEQDGGRPDRSSLEALTFARRLATSTGDALAAVLFGPEAAAAAAALGAFGVSSAWVVEHPALDSYAPAAWGRTMAQVVAASSPVIVLAAGNDRGQEVLAYAATMAGAPMAANCVEIRPGAPFEVTRQRWGGSLLEDARLEGTVRFVTIAEHATPSEEAAAPSAVKVETFTPTLSDADLRVRVVARVAPEAGKISLADARVVVGGGRGVGGSEAFSELEELALLLHGAVGVSRVVTSAGWRPHSQQVGQTGTRIAPDIYIACGISGAIQHIVGCKAAKAILVINTDREAPIMARAAYAVIGDLHTVVPAISAEIRRRPPSPPPALVPGPALTPPPPAPHRYRGFQNRPQNFEGGGEVVTTRVIQLGRLTLCQLSYSRRPTKRYHGWSQSSGPRRSRGCRCDPRDRGPVAD